MPFTLHMVIGNLEKKAGEKPRQGANTCKGTTTHTHTPLNTIETDAN